MALTNAERQARHRARAFGPDGDKRPLHIDLETPTIAQLRRLGRHYGRSVTATIGVLAETADSRLRGKLKGRALREYLGEDQFDRR